jgi:DnaJ-class molecular chaperone
MPDQFSERDRYRTCPDCDGSGVQGEMLVSPDPQTWVDDTCRTCWGDGVIRSNPEYVQLIRDAASNHD